MEQCGNFIHWLDFFGEVGVGRFPHERTYTRSLWVWNKKKRRKAAYKIEVMGMVCVRVTEVVGYNAFTWRHREYTMMWSSQTWCFKRENWMGDYDEFLGCVEGGWWWLCGQRIASYTRAEIRTSRIVKKNHVSSHSASNGLKFCLLFSSMESIKFISRRYNQCMYNTTY
jgi:hypothetical protein